MSVTFLEFPGRVLSVEVTPDVPGLIRRAVTVRVESGPPLTPAEYWRMSAAVAASLIALGYNVHYWEPVPAQRP